MNDIFKSLKILYFDLLKPLIDPYVWYLWFSAFGFIYIVFYLTFYTHFINLYLKFQTVKH